MIELGSDVVRFWVYELGAHIDACVLRIKEREAGSSSRLRSTAAMKSA